MPQQINGAEVGAAGIRPCRSVCRLLRRSTQAVPRAIAEMARPFHPAEPLLVMPASSRRYPRRAGPALVRAQPLRGEPLHDAAIAGGASASARPNRSTAPAGRGCGDRCANTSRNAFAAEWLDCPGDPGSSTTDASGTTSRRIETRELVQQRSRPALSRRRPCESAPFCSSRLASSAPALWNASRRRSARARVRAIHASQAHRKRPPPLRPRPCWMRGISCSTGMASSVTPRRPIRTSLRRAPPLKATGPRAGRGPRPRR